MNAHPNTLRSAGRPKRQRGFTLLEVLVSFVILTFGILGLTGMQAKLLEYNQSSLFRTQATALADDVLDRMRADNPTNARNHETSQGWNTVMEDSAEDLLSTRPELADWKASVESLLPMGTASIRVAPTTHNVTITISWDDSRGQDAVPMDFETVSRL